jgi:hypothetical protein
MFQQHSPFLETNAQGFPQNGRILRLSPISSFAKVTLVQGEMPTFHSVKGSDDGGGAAWMGV